MNQPSDASDCDPQETEDWLASLDTVMQTGGADRARFLLEQLDKRALELGLGSRTPSYSAYRNTIGLDDQSPHPGDVAIEERITAIVRWNALAMVVRANHAHGELGGHIASYASAAEIFEMGFNHFFRGPEHPDGADLVYFQPHSSPGIYARAYMEGRLQESQLANYRREVGGQGLSSYPHPWLMPDFWQFPTGSMGLGPICSIYQARFMRYLKNRGLLEVGHRHVWGIFGDGEMDEPESIAALTLAARERLDNLTWIINCNLQRLDGPVRSNGQVIQELESLFVGAGWNVIKVLWGSDWDPLFARDSGHVLLRQLAATVDGQYQTLGANDGAYNREHFFRLAPELRQLVSHMSAEQIDALKRGGHDFRKLYAAFAAARNHVGQPTVILAKTKKGYGMGDAGESRNTSHQQKKLNTDALYVFRSRFNLPLNDEQLASLSFLRPAEASAEMRYLRERRSALGGALPHRASNAAPVCFPSIDSYASFALSADGKGMSTTMAVVRMLSNLLRDRAIGPRVVPIVADEARTFGMANLFRQIGIYSPAGQLYQPEDGESMLSYREAKQGQLLEEGITEAGALSSWIAAATAYSAHGFRMLPIYIFYSMFGFQRVGDLIWAAADQRSRGILLGATAGRTTLSGEGLQHQDGTSQLSAAMIPNCRAYDPAFAGELAVILHHAASEIMERDADTFYYITVMNESYAQPSLPHDAADDVIKGMYLYAAGPADCRVNIRLLGSGAILREVIAAASLLEQDWGIGAEVWSVTSFSELEREAREVLRQNRLHPTQPPTESFVGRRLSGKMPVLAVSDYVSTYASMIARFVRAPFFALGTDGFGRSDTRSELRRFFEIDRHSVVITALQALATEGAVQPPLVVAAIERYGVQPQTAAPWMR